MHTHMYTHIKVFVPLCVHSHAGLCMYQCAQVDLDV